MTIAQDIIQRGFREDNLIPVGKQPTANEQAESLVLLNGFMLSVYGYELGENMEDWVAPQPQRTAPVAANFPQLPYPLANDFMVNPSPLASDYTLNIYPYPPPNSRIVWSGAPLQVWMPEAPRPGSRIALVQGSGASNSEAQPGAQLVLNGNGRLIELPDGSGVGATVTLTNPADPVKWFYRDDTGVWRVIRKLALTDELPYPEEFDDFWIGALSIRLAPRYNKTVSEDTKNNTARMLAKMKTEFRQVSPTVYKSDDIPRALESYTSGRWSW